MYVFGKTWAFVAINAIKLDDECPTRVTKVRAS